MFMWTTDDSKAEDEMKHQNNFNKEFFNKIYLQK